MLSRIRANKETVVFPKLDWENPGKWDTHKGGIGCTLGYLWVTMHAMHTGLPARTRSRTLPCRGRGVVAHPPNRVVSRWRPPPFHCNHPLTHCNLTRMADCICIPYPYSVSVSRWSPLSEHEVGEQAKDAATRSSPETDAMPSPVLFGAVFAVHKQAFLARGGFDEEFGR